MSVNDIPLALILQRQVPRRPPKRPLTYVGPSHYQAGMSWERPDTNWNKRYLPVHYQADREALMSRGTRRRCTKSHSKSYYVPGKTSLGETNLRFWAAAPTHRIKARGQCRMCLNFEEETHFKRHAAAYDCSSLLRRVYHDLLVDEKCGNCGRFPAKEQRWGVPFCNSGCMNAWCWNANAQGFTKEKSAIYGPAHTDAFCKRKLLEVTA